VIIETKSPNGDTIIDYVTRLGKGSDGSIEIYVRLIASQDALAARLSPKLAREIVECMQRCQAVQRSDQMVCHACAIAWDMNDPHPPLCPRKE